MTMQPHKPAGSPGGTGGQFDHGNGNSNSVPPTLTQMFDQTRQYVRAGNSYPWNMRTTAADHHDEAVRGYMNYLRDPVDPAHVGAVIERIKEVHSHTDRQAVGALAEQVAAFQGALTAQGTTVKKLPGQPLGSANNNWQTLTPTQQEETDLVASAGGSPAQQNAITYQAVHGYNPAATTAIATGSKKYTAAERKRDLDSMEKNPKDRLAAADRLDMTASAIDTSMADTMQGGYNLPGTQGKAHAVSRDLYIAAAKRYATLSNSRAETALRRAHALNNQGEPGYSRAAATQMNKLAKQMHIKFNAPRYTF